MKYGIIIALAVFWVVMAFRQFQRGDTLMAGVFLVAGTALTIHRLRKA